MEKLPNFDKAFIDEAKLKEYCLNENHPVGKHKARLFHSKLSLTSAHSSILKGKILEGIAYSEAFKKHADSYGNQYSVEFKIRNFGQEANIITIWIILNGENFPRLITCYLKK